MVRRDLAALDRMTDHGAAMLRGRAVEEASRADPGAARLTTADARGLSRASCDRMLDPRQDAPA
jgi:hypothetical protein